MLAARPPPERRSACPNLPATNDPLLSIVHVGWPAMAFATAPSMLANMTTAPVIVSLDGSTTNESPPGRYGAACDW